MKWYGVLKLKWKESEYLHQASESKIGMPKAGIRKAFENKWALENKARKQ